MLKPGQNTLVLILSLWNKAFIYFNEIFFENKISYILNFIPMWINTFHYSIHFGIGSGMDDARR